MFVMHMQRRECPCHQASMHAGGLLSYLNSTPCIQQKETETQPKGSLALGRLVPCHPDNREVTERILSHLVALRQYLAQSNLQHTALTEFDARLLRDSTVSSNACNAAAELHARGRR